MNNENSTLKKYSSGNDKNTRVKVKTRKKTVGITLPTKLIQRARKHKLNISKISEQALRSILDYSETQNNNQNSDFLGECSFQKEGSVVPRAGLEPATSGNITR